MLVIRDKQLAKDLEQLAKREHRPVEELLKSMVARYPGGELEATSASGGNEAIMRARQKVYAKARKYWQSVGDQVKAAMTDQELDEEFGAFDENGIPRLKSELQSLEPLPGSLAYAAAVSERGNFRSGKPDLAQRSREILDTHLADDYLKRKRGEDAEG